MPRRPTITDVAERAGVSKGAVSFALNDRPGVGAATRDRILVAARELGWEPDHRARALSRSRADAVGLVLSRQAALLAYDPFFPLFLAGVESTLAEAEKALLLHVVQGRAAEGRAYRRLARGRVDGVFLTDLRERDPRIGLLGELGLPALAVGRPQPDADVPWLAIDDRVGIKTATEHLIGLGHRRIAHVTGAPGYVHTASRRYAWSASLREAGLPPGPVATGDFSADSGGHATRRLLAAAQPPTAIVYANDLMAMAGVRALADAGLRVPGDVSVTGFDDVAVAPLATPPLSTVRHDVLGWGRAAAAALLALVAGRDARTGWLDPPEFVVRASTAPPPGSQDPSASPDPTDDQTTRRTS